MPILVLLYVQLLTGIIGIDGYVAYAKLSLKKYSPIAARNEDKKVCSGLL